MKWLGTFWNTGKSSYFKLVYGYPGYETQTDCYFQIHIMHYEVTYSDIKYTSKIKIKIIQKNQDKAKHFS